MEIVYLTLSHFNNDTRSYFLKHAGYKSLLDYELSTDNTLFELAWNNHKKQFVLDRGSNKPLDVVGVTADTLKDRFPAGHGMIGIGKTVLNIFNSSLSAIKSPLKKLGLLDNPNILLNIEFIV